MDRTQHHEGTRARRIARARALVDAVIGQLGEVGERLAEMQAQIGDGTLDPEDAYVREAVFGALATLRHVEQDAEEIVAQVTKGAT
jgi:hypothetical protein